MLESTNDVKNYMQSFGQSISLERERECREKSKEYDKTGRLFDGLTAHELILAVQWIEEQPRLGFALRMVSGGAFDNEYTQSVLKEAEFGIQYHLHSILGDQKSDEFLKEIEGMSESEIEQSLIADGYDMEELRIHHQKFVQKIEKRFEKYESDAEDFEERYPHGFSLEELQECGFANFYIIRKIAEGDISFDHYLTTGDNVLVNQIMENQECLDRENAFYRIAMVRRAIHMYGGVK